MPASSSQRGYGYRHRQLRAEWARRIESGGGAYCARCFRLIAPDDAWHLDHDSYDRGSRERGRYIGVSHASCNVSEPSKRLKHGKVKRVVRFVSPNW